MSDPRDHACNPASSGVPGTLALTFTHPEGVLRSTAVSPARKREILAGWASDAHAVPDLPALRQLDSGAIVPLDTVLDALRRLDEAPQERQTLPLVSRRLSARWRKAVRFHRPHDDNDDDPPPAPAAALPPGVDLELRRRRDAAWAGAAA